MTRRLMPIAALAACLAAGCAKPVGMDNAAGAAAGVSGATTPAADEAKLQGEWGVDDVAINLGQGATPHMANSVQQALRGFRFVIVGDRVTLTTPSGTRTQVMTLEPARSPKVMMLDPLPGAMGPGSSAIYKLEGQHFVFAQNLSTGELPADFVPVPSPGGRPFLNFRTTTPSPPAFPQFNGSTRRW